MLKAEQTPLTPCKAEVAAKGLRPRGGLVLRSPLAAPRQTERIVKRRLSSKTPPNAEPTRTARRPCTEEYENAAMKAMESIQEKRKIEAKARKAAKDANDKLVKDAAKAKPEEDAAKSKGKEEASVAAMQTTHGIAATTGVKQDTPLRIKRLPAAMDDGKHKKGRSGTASARPPCPAPGGGSRQLSTAAARSTTQRRGQHSGVSVVPATTTRRSR